jgi:hypothetical protein
VVCDVRCCHSPPTHPHFSLALAVMITTLRLSLVVDPTETNPNESIVMPGVVCDARCPVRVSLSLSLFFAQSLLSLTCSLLVISLHTLSSLTLSTHSLSSPAVFTHNVPTITNKQTDIQRWTRLSPRSTTQTHWPFTGFSLSALPWRKAGPL